MDPGDRVWYAPIEGGLYGCRGKKLEVSTKDLLNQDVIYSIAGSKGELWLGRQQGGLRGCAITADRFGQQDLHRAKWTGTKQCLHRSPES